MTIAKTAAALALVTPYQTNDEQRATLRCGCDQQETGESRGPSVILHGRDSFMVAHQCCMFRHKTDMSHVHDTDTGPRVWCDFCGKRSNEVAAMIAADRTHICGECVKVCVEVLNQTDGSREYDSWGNQSFGDKQA